MVRERYRRDSASGPAVSLPVKNISRAQRAVCRFLCTRETADHVTPRA